MGAYFLYSITENNVEPVFSMSSEHGELRRLANDNIADTDGYKYLPFFTLKDNEAKKTNGASNKTIFACEIATGRLKCIDVEIDSERQWLEDVYMNWDGGLNIVLSPGKGTDDDMQNQHQYFITREKWQELFDKAPYC
jgi:hypothetical protein